MLKDLLPAALRDVDKKRGERPDLIVKAWGEVAEEKWRAMTQACSFEKGFLMVKVKIAALYAVLVQHEREKLLKRLQEKFPQVKNIIFRIG